VGTLVLVRHGQASSLTEGDYDQLSPLGMRQARLLGEHWAARRRHFDRVYVGPRKRHAQTHGEVLAAYASHDLSLPAPQPLDALDEHHGILVVREALPELASKDAELAAMVESLARGEAVGGDFLRVFRRVMRVWADGRLPLREDGPETFPAFRARVREGVRLMLSEASLGQRIAAFTSGGAMAAAVCDALGIDDGRAMDLSFAIRNAAVCELRYSGERASLSVFNATPHLDDDALLTMV
jgi:broad specificity phosphatase PhoE